MAMKATARIEASPTIGTNIAGTEIRVNTQKLSTDAAKDGELLKLGGVPRLDRVVGGFPMTFEAGIKLATTRKLDRDYVKGGTVVATPCACVQFRPMDGDFNPNLTYSSTVHSDLRPAALYDVKARFRRTLLLKLPLRNSSNKLRRLGK
jgi:hypothetical protein